MTRRTVTTIIAGALMTIAIVIAWSRIDTAIDTTYGLGYPDVETTSSKTIGLVRAFPALKFSQPVFITPAPHTNDQLYVVEKAGRIRVFDHRPDVTESRIFFEVDVRSGGEQGLLGLAFAPDYESSGHFFVYYTADTGPRRSIISRFRAVDGSADPESERILLEVPQPYSNHNGGMLCFGPDGHLYIGLGDGGSAGDPKGHGQNTRTHLGSILRIQPTEGGFAIPKDNPLVSNPGHRPEIFAWGLRNPWRFSFDRDTGQLWVGDVGQNKREEISIVECGDNLGWKIWEGELVYERAWKDRRIEVRRPVFTYAPSIGYSITGGYVYRGSEVPSLAGAYVYGDYGSGKVWALRREDGFVVSNTELGRIRAVSSFGEDLAGELYALSLSGEIWKLAGIE